MQTFSRLDGPKAFGYDVFLSFRGIDTRDGFTGFLYQSLSKRGFRTFLDNRELHGGDGLTQELFRAIEKSKIFVIVLSKNYASSSFCLDELVHILHEFAKGNGRRIFTVFYHVSSADLVVNTPATCQRSEKWIEALTKVGAPDFSSWHLHVAKDKPEYEYIEEIIREVSKHGAYPIGLHRRIHKVQRYLDSTSSGGRGVSTIDMVGICGNPGIGKTTLVRGVYCYNADSGFDCYFFVDNVGGYLSEHDGLISHLKRMLISKTIGDNDGMAMLRQKKVFLVLEDVDDPTQLKDIVELIPNWFGSGSKVIITARDKDLLKNQGIEKIYDVERFNDDEAYELLNAKAFNSEGFPVSYLDIIDRAKTCADGYPRILEEMCSYFAGKSVEECNTVLNRYESITNGKTKTIHALTQDMVRYNVPQEDPGEHSESQLSEEYESNTPQAIEELDLTEMEQELPYQC